MHDDAVLACIVHGHAAEVLHAGASDVDVRASDSSETAMRRRHDVRAAGDSTSSDQAYSDAKKRHLGEAGLIEVQNAFYWLLLLKANRQLTASQQTTHNRHTDSSTTDNRHTDSSTTDNITTDNRPQHNRPNQPVTRVTVIVSGQSVVVVAAAAKTA